MKTAPCELGSITDKDTNCYLLKTANGFFMIDSGYAFSRRVVNKALVEAGCKPGNLKLIVLTHGDVDHTGNCKYLRRKYAAKIAIHRDEAVAAVTGDMLAVRKNPTGAFLKFLMVLVRLVMPRRFKPDILLTDGDDLSQYGLTAKVLHTPGHTIGSISILTTEGDLFCGDLLVGGRNPGINHLVDDLAQMKAGVSRIKGLDIRQVYPGHGRPFTLQELMKNDGKID
jgi:hydroxyacylglutathione hydrolase